MEIGIGDLLIWQSEDRMQGTSTGACAIVSELIFSYGGTQLARLRFLKGGDRLITDSEALIAVDNIRNSIRSGKIIKYEKKG